MQLQPRRRPGRNDRKAAAYLLEIARLRSEGYTFEAIREALADVGVDLSEATLRRELRRPLAPICRVFSTVLPASPAVAIATGSPPPVSSTVPPAFAGSSGRQIAEAFFNANPSNPLLRARDNP